MLDCVIFFISVCVNGKNKTDEVSRGHLAVASTPSIAARMESQLEQQQIMKVGQRKVNKSQRKAETDREEAGRVYYLGSCWISFSLET